MSIDSVTYADGEFEGPDSLKFYEKLAARERVRAEFNTALLSMRDANESTLREWLSAKATKAPTGGEGLNNIDLAGTYERNQASFALKLLDRNQRSKLFGSLESEHLRIAARPALHAKETTR